MENLYFVTTSIRKFISLNGSFSKFGLSIEQKNIELQEIQSYDVEYVASNKAMHAFSMLKKPCIVQDSGFYIKSLNDFPGALVKPILSCIGIEGLLKLAENKDRECEFIECFAYIDKNIKKPICFEQRVKGNLSVKQQGTLKDKYWSSLYQIFIPFGLNKTIAEMSLEEHKKWNEYSSHEYEINLAKYLKKLNSSKFME